MSPDRMYHVTREKYGSNKGYVAVMEPEGSQIVTAVSFLSYNFYCSYIFLFIALFCLFLVLYSRAIYVCVVWLGAVTASG